MKANLRVCASCKWIFDIRDNDNVEEGCPKCKFGHYGARYVYGNKAYVYKYTQEPWKNQKMNDYDYKLECEISRDNTFKKEKKSTIDLTISLIKAIEGE